MLEDRMQRLEDRIEALESLALQQQDQINKLNKSLKYRARGPMGIVKDKMWDYIKANPGCTTAAVRRIIGGRYGKEEIERFVSELRTEGKVIERIPNPQHTGGRRGTVWFAREEEK